MSRLYFSKELRSLSLAVAALLGVAHYAATANAALFVYDPFATDGGPADYLAGNDDTGVNVLGGQNPATGPTAFYAGGWIQSGGDAQAVNGNTLEYPFFPRGGSAVTDSVQFSCCSFGRSGREIAGGLGGGRDPQTIYQSFLVDFGNQGADDPANFGKRGVEWWNGGLGDSFLAVDLFVNSFAGVNNLRLAVTTPSGSNFSELDGGAHTLASLAGVHLIVMKFEFDPALPDVVSVFLDPTSSVEGDWTPAAVVSAPNSDLYITHHGGLANFTFSGGGHVPGRFDELRWGETFADVTPFIPEPAGLTLLGLSIGSLLIGRRRK
ncbi:MAG: hypothetical protein KF847_11825 [Pirellulales bacterium]|nr:hypothetical protein [Pirellulales bacterium]